MNPWLLEILVVRDGSHDGGERRSLARDVERGLLLRMRRGAYVERTAFEAMSLEDQHVVRMRALAAVSPEPPVFSHWSAAVLHGLPVLRARLTAVHTTVESRSGRGQDGVAGHLFRLTGAEVMEVGHLRVTSPPRTVVDVAGGSPIEEGVMVADAALRCGIPREVLEAAVDLAGPRASGRRIVDVVAFAHPGSESAAESWSRVTMLRIGVAPPELQWRVVLSTGSVVFLDFFFPLVHAAGEADGAKKYLDPALAPQGAGRAVYEEKRREDEVRRHVRGLARWGWLEAGNAALLRPILARIGVLTAAPRAVLADYAAAARPARPRVLAGRRLVQR